jgi:glycine hydroxymethyltransferase
MYNDYKLQNDTILNNIIDLEKIRQEEYVNLIASENYVSSSILKIQGSILTNKYAEGYSNNRYYAGCKYIDQIETLAINRAKELFKVDYVNVQPHSGSQANQAIYLALLNPGDMILGMHLKSGGHLTHGSKFNYSGKIFKAITYNVNEDSGLIDYDNLKKIAYTYKPKLIIAGFSAYSRIVDWQYIYKIAKHINAYFMVDMAHIAGLVATNLYDSPIPYADIISTTTHKTLRGPRGGMLLSKKLSSLSNTIDHAIFPGLQGGPLMHVIAAKAASFYEASSTSFIIYQNQVIKNSKLMANIFIKNNFDIVSNGTDNHMFLLNMTKKNITGKETQEILERINILTNKNLIPGDLLNAKITSGIRIGTPAITTRGFKEEQIIKITNLIIKALDNKNNNTILLEIKNEIIQLCKLFPIYF